MRLGSFKNPDIELLRQKEVHGKGVKGLAIWNSPEDIDESSNDRTRKIPFIVTGSYDGTVKVWSYNDLECLITLNHHPEGVWDVKTHKNLLPGPPRGLPGGTSLGLPSARGEPAGLSSGAWAPPWREAPWSEPRALAPQGLRQGPALPPLPPGVHKPETSHQPAAHAGEGAMSMSHL